MTTTLLEPRAAAAPRADDIARIDSLMAEGRADEALALALHRASRDPGDADARIRVVALRWRNGEMMPALRDCAELIAAFPTTANVVRFGAEFLLALHRNVENLVAYAEEPFRLDASAMGVELPPALAMARDYLPRATRLAEAAVALAPDDAHGRFLLVSCLATAGRHADAARHASRAAPHPASPVAQLQIATSRFLARRDGASEALRHPTLLAAAPSLAHSTRKAFRIARGPARIGERAPLPYEAVYAGRVHERVLHLAGGPPTLESLRDASLIGAHLLPVAADGVARIHGVVDEPRVQWGTVEDRLGQLGRRCVVIAADDRAGLWVDIPRAGRRIEGRAFLLASNFSGNYYHWLFDGLGRLLAMPEVIDDPSVRLIVGSNVTPWQLETLAMLGVDASRLERVADDEMVAVDELLVARHHRDGNSPSPSVVRFIRDRLGAPAPATRGTRRLYLARYASSTMRRVANEREVIDIVSRHGFEVVSPAEMTVAEQRALFAQASVVAGAVGAAFANLVFAPPGARTVMFGHRGFIVPCYDAVAHACGHSVRYVLGHELTTHVPYPHWDFMVDPADLALALARLPDR